MKQSRESRIHVVHHREGTIVHTGHGWTVASPPYSGLNSSLTFAMRTPPDNRSADPAGRGLWPDRGHEALAQLLKA